MGLLDDVFDAAVEIVAAPVTIPHEILKKTEDLLKGRPSKYEHWYHDGGQGKRPEDDRQDD